MASVQGGDVDSAHLYVILSLIQSHLDQVSDGRQPVSLDLVLLYVEFLYLV